MNLLISSRDWSMAFHWASVCVILGYRRRDKGYKYAAELDTEDEKKVRTSHTMICG